MKNISQLFLVHTQTNIAWFNIILMSHKVSTFVLNKSKVLPGPRLLAINSNISSAHFWIYWRAVIPTVGQVLMPSFHPLQCYKKAWLQCMLSNFVNCILLSLLVHLAFWTSIFSHVELGTIDVCVLLLLLLQARGCSGVVQRWDLSLLQSKWHVPMSKFLLDSPNLPAGSWTASLDIPRVWLLFCSHVAAFSFEGLCISWLQVQLDPNWWLM